jgi:hypothetical protein
MSDLPAFQHFKILNTYGKAKRGNDMLDVVRSSEIVGYELRMATVA